MTNNVTAFCDSNEEVLTESEKCDISMSISSKAHMLGTKQQRTEGMGKTINTV